MDDVKPWCEVCGDAAGAQLAVLQARVARLEAALARWTTADHGYPLHIGRCETADGGLCTCGLEEAIALLAPAEPTP